MRYILLSDVHANLPALEAVLHDASLRDGIDATYHLGDLVGHAPWPNEVVDRITDAGIAGVAGNFDSTVATGHKHCGCRYEDTRQEVMSHISYAWTRKHISPHTRAVLGALPFRIDVRPLGGHAVGPTLILVHGNQALNTVYVTEDCSDDFLLGMGRSLGARAGDVVAFGHTHRIWHRVVDGVHYVNTGSVGRPRDGDPRAAYVLLEVTESDVSVDVVRVDYDVESTAQAILASELPNDFAQFLRQGGQS
ncbi:MAG TPA: metallophosphoesterase family protein [Gemmatimonadaceae bacterium]